MILWLVPNPAVITKSRPRAEQSRPAGVFMFLHAPTKSQLRVIASQELKKRRAFYIKESDSTLPEDTALAGTWAEATSLYALANASHLDLRIWAWDNLLSQWRFYNISPDIPNKKTPPQIIYLKLQSLHYEFLKPRESIPAEVEAQWLDSAILKPATLKGVAKNLSSTLKSAVSSAFLCLLTLAVAAATAAKQINPLLLSAFSVWSSRHSAPPMTATPSIAFFVWSVAKQTLWIRSINSIKSCPMTSQLLNLVTISSVVVVGSLLKARAMSRKQKPIITGKNVKVANLLCNHANSD